MLSAFVASPWGLAQNTEQQDQTEPKKAFDVIVVTGTRGDQALRDVAASISAINSQQLEKQMAQTLADAVKYEPGVMTNGRGRFGTRNFNVRGMEGNRVKLMVDGVEQPNAYNPGADVMNKGANVYEIDTLTAMEVNKGPSSSLFGSDALGATVMLKTKDPQDVIKAGQDYAINLKTGYSGVNNGFKQTLELAKSADIWEGLMIYTLRNGHETKTHSSGKDINGPARGQADPLHFRSHNFLIKNYWHINDDHRLGLINEFHWKDLSITQLSKEGESWFPGLTYTNARGEDRDSRARVGLNHRWYSNSDMFDKLFWQLSYQASRSEHNSYDKTELLGNRNRERNGDDSSLQFELQLDKELNFDYGRHQLTYGANYIRKSFDLDYKNHDFDSGTVDVVNPETPAAESEKRALFLQDNMFFLDDDLVVTAGVRYDQYIARPKGNNQLKDHRSNAFTTRLGGVYHYNENWSNFFQYSEGFRSPDLNELYYNIEGADWEVIANPELKPEQSRTYEFGLRHEQAAAHFEVSAYYNDYHNFIEMIVDRTDPDYPNGIFTNRNIAKAEIYGAEFKGQLDLAKSVGLPKGSYSRLSVSYSKGNNQRTGEELHSIAPMSAVFGLGYDNEAQTWGMAMNLTMAASTDYRGWENDVKPPKAYDLLESRDSNESAPPANAPGYAVMDITTYFSPMKDMTIRAGVYNLFDTKYWYFQDIRGFEQGAEELDRFTQPGRHFSIELGYKF
ncbi:TonB-dependent hemoglobin/transferrin/lactoferrin family receptor [Paraferrimonas sp. SM1919]|uniref:TonB-dependent hemoglobin/transferrin/lactoferrin family receptor n=1 Tax=Paraferrimonas sp. SM1919 TaxID=2662263 RepID=UPI0013D1056F|nr:TonB-dependent hemoglobin/transferrin/lactoferrin family receptor [Paraferrimonas sp. SM1919]